jgi:tetratricopeptide (TPR) repeat protein
MDNTTAMDSLPLGTSESSNISYETISELEVDAVDIDYDDNYIYAACRDLRIRVWSKREWQLVAELSETLTEPLAVDVDQEQIYATCEKRAYVWKKETWGMIGWFELSYQALTSFLQGDYFFVGARDGRLVSIQKDTHDTSSWQLHKSDMVSIWCDERVICTSTKKEEPRVWLKNPGSAPSELARLDIKGKGGVVTGNSEFIFIGTSSGEVAIYDRTDWEIVRTLEAKNSTMITSMWASEHYLIGATSPGSITIWDVKNGEEIGTIQLNGHKIQYVTADHDMLYVATPDGIFIVRMSVSGAPLDVAVYDQMHVRDSLLKTSPYDVLESALVFEKRGDERFQESMFQDAVVEFENALQILIDNAHTLQEVPEERELLMDELNARLGKALLKSKIQELQNLDLEICQLSEELEVKKRTDMSPEEVERQWAIASRAIKESRVLAEAQGADMLSYQLIHIVDTLESDFLEAMSRYDKFRETINQALALIRNIANEWRWMERKRTNLTERKEYLEGAIAKITAALEATEKEGEVHQILAEALSEYNKIYTQIGRIISSYETEQEQIFSNRDDASEAIEQLLSVMPKKREELKTISNKHEREKETKLVKAALNQALDVARNFKLTKSIQAIEDELAAFDVKDVEKSES